MHAGPADLDGRIQQALQGANTKVQIGRETGASWGRVIRVWGQQSGRCRHLWNAGRALMPNDQMVASIIEVLLDALARPRIDSSPFAVAGTAVGKALPAQLLRSNDIRRVAGQPHLETGRPGQRWWMVRGLTGLGRNPMADCIDEQVGGGHVCTSFGPRALLPGPQGGRPVTVG